MATFESHSHRLKKLDPKKMKEIFGRHPEEVSDWHICIRCLNIIDEVRMTAHQVMSRKKKSR